MANPSPRIRCFHGHGMYDRTHYAKTPKTDTTILSSKQGCSVRMTSWIPTESDWMNLKIRVWFRKLIVKKIFKFQSKEMKPCHERKK
jgi:hypothetical protein